MKRKIFISSVQEVKCAHFHGMEVCKPIPFYQVYKGTVFEVTDQALNFVLSKIDLAVGTRAKSVQAPIAYEIPPDVVREAIVNAVAHRDYTSNGSVQVMLFSDRLEVWNPGSLPPSLTLDKLRKPHSSIPANPLLAESLYLAKYIERIGTGTRDMIHDCKNAGLAEPEFSLTDGFVVTVYRKPGRAFEAVGGKRQLVLPIQSSTQSIDPVSRLLIQLKNMDMSSSEIMTTLGLKHRHTFRINYLHPALKAGFIEHTIPDKPNSRFQKYHLTRKGTMYLKKHRRLK